MAGFSFSTNPATSASQSPFPFASSSSPSPSSFSNPSPSFSIFGSSTSTSASSTPSFGFSFASSSSSTPSSAAPSPSFGFGAFPTPTTGSALFGRSSPAVASPFGGSGLFGSSSSSTGTATTTTTTSLFGFGASSAPSLSSNTTTTASSPFSSGLFGSSPSSTTFGASSASALSSTATTPVSSPFSSGLFGSSSPSTAFGASPSGTSSMPATTAAAPSFPSLFGASSTSPSFSNLTGSSSSSSISSSVTTPPTSTSGFSFLSASSSSSVTSSASQAPSFSFPSAPTSSGSTASFWVGFSSSPSSFSFANVTASSVLQSSSGLASNLRVGSTTVAATTTASASTTASSTSFPAFGVPYTASTTSSTGSGSMSSFGSSTSVAASTGTSSSFLGFQTSSTTTGVHTTSASQPQSTAASSLFGVPGITTNTSTVTTTAQTSSSLVVSSSSGTTTSTGAAAASAPKLPSEITGKTVEEIIKQWNVELQEQTGKFRKQANAIAEWDKRILQNHDVLLKLEAEVAKVVETQSNFERQLELIETHQQEMSQAQPFSEGDNVEFESVNVEEEASQAQPQPQRPQLKRTRQSKKRSDVWNHFVEFKDGQGTKKSKCNYCGKEYFSSSKLGTTSLRTHLLHCASYKSTLNDSQTHLAFQEEKLVSWKFDQMISQKSIVQMIVEDELPFSFVEGMGFRNFVNIVQPLLKVPCRTTVTQDTLKMFEDHKKQVLELLKGNKSRLCFTTDSWTSIKKDNYMVLTAHFIDNDWRLKKKVLNFCLLHSHRGIDIGKQIEECLLGWDIDNVMTISVDNAYANDFAIDYLRKRFASWPKCILKGKWIHIRCVAHILNLMVQDGMKQMNASINNIRGAVKWVRYSPSRLVNFRRYAKMEGCESTKSLCFDVLTRWNSTYLMLEAALVYEKAFDKYNKEDRAFGDDLEKLDLSVPSSLDWENARKLNRFLKQFYDVTLKVSGTHYVTSHTFFDDIMSIDVLLKDDTEGMKDLGLKEMITQMKVKFDKYYGDIEKVNLLLYIAVILDPRTKLGYLGLILVDVYGEKRGGSMKKVIEDALKELYDEYVRLHAPSIADSSTSSVLGKHSSSEETKPNPTKRDQMLERLKMEKSKGGSIESTKSELDKYLNEDEEDNSKSFDILLWWKLNSMRFPILSMMARDILAIPISTVASESVFSTNGRVLDPFRSSLTPKIVEALICLQDWIRANPIPSIEEDFNKLHLIEEEIGSWCSSNKI